MTMSVSDQSLLVDQLRRGDCTPVLGPDLLPGALGRDDALRRSWASEYDFPFGEDRDLAEVLQHAAVVERDRTTVTQRLATALALRQPADLSDPRDPYALLASLPISVYLTTDPYDMLAAALTRRERTPVVAVCGWYHGARTSTALRLPGDYRPSVDQPLVLHLYGSVLHVASLVATEQDHLALAAALITDDARGDHEVVPIQVLPALTQRRLLFVGHRFGDWTFRLLLRTLLDRTAPARHPAVLVTPPLEPEPSDLSTFWATTDEFFGYVRESISRS
jgi:hypothetical protein